MNTNTVIATVEVAVDPHTAFAIFTEEIDDWWRAGPINWNHPDRAIGIRIEPGVGGRWIEVEGAATGEGVECGRITVWEPGERLTFLYRDTGELDDTEVDISFEAVGGDTRGHAPAPRLDALPGEIAARRRGGQQFAWTNISLWYSEWSFWGSPRRVGSAISAG
jgi:uncharacterized protein YndB with AHSA1/START domain